MKCENKIAILMATYNGAMYIREQMDSLLCQTFTDWHLYIHDDGSTDETADIIAGYVQANPDKITVLTYPSQGGACHNFFSLLEAVEAPYYMFCDQDDVWLTEKIEKSFARMTQTERDHPGKAILVHSDLLLTDARLNVTSSSFLSNQRIRTDVIKTFEDYAATNTVTGCTTLFNQQAKASIKRPYKKAIMHDAWLCLSVVADDGIIELVNEPLLKYRQHAGNALGSTDMSRQTTLHKLLNIKRIVTADIRHYREMNAIKPISLWSFIKAKWHYRKNYYL